MRNAVYQHPRLYPDFSALAVRCGASRWSDPLQIFQRRPHLQVRERVQYRWDHHDLEFDLQGLAGSLLLGGCCVQTESTACRGSHRLDSIRDPSVREGLASALTEGCAGWFSTFTSRCCQLPPVTVSSHGAALLCCGSRVHVKSGRRPRPRRCELAPAAAAEPVQ
ncbi:hypothetical protein BDZ45DRAFT_260290 [Acephala macrosclerotiorum]|nr:hypothetical protein BDZ45DRAFT_260290 [Acephala macrosclerotiorum]